MPFRSPEYWRARAEAVRTVAKGMINPDAVQGMLKTAEGYDQLSEHLGWTRLRLPTTVDLWHGSAHLPPPEPITTDPAVLWTVEALAADWNSVRQSLAGSRKAIQHSRDALAHCRPWGAEHEVDQTSRDLHC
jgi:hypothetical protein